MSKNRREWEGNPKKNRKERFQKERREEEEFETLEDRERPNFKEEKRFDKKRKSA